MLRSDLAFQTIDDFLGRLRFECLHDTNLFEEELSGKLWAFKKVLSIKLWTFSARLLVVWLSIVLSLRLYWCPTPLFRVRYNFHIYHRLVSLDSLIHSFLAPICCVSSLRSLGGGQRLLRSRAAQLRLQLTDLLL